MNNKKNLQSNVVVVLISANTEWRAVKQHLNVPEDLLNESPYGEWFTRRDSSRSENLSVIFFHGGWGKVSAGASTQYVIDRWKPSLLINLGTCGGFQGRIELGEIILVERTVIYDIIEQMGDSLASIVHYSSDLDLSWLQEPYPIKVRKTLLVSGDRDLIPGEIEELHQHFGAVAGDWESGAIAYIARKNHVKLLILRGVSDLVSSRQGEAYVDGGHSLFQRRALEIMGRLLDALPEWLACAV